MSSTNTRAPAGCRLPEVYSVGGCQACPLVAGCPVAETGTLTREPWISQDIGELRAALDRRLPMITARTLTRMASEGPIPGDKPLPPPAHTGPQRTVLGLDCSGSMNSRDYAPSRMDGGHLAGRKYLEARAGCGGGDLAAVVAFNASARAVCKLTPLGSGLASILAAIDRITAGGNTSIGAGLVAAEQLLSETTAGWLARFFVQTPRSVSTPRGYLDHVILLSDGDHNTDPEPLSVAARLKQQGVLITCIGIGEQSEINEKLLRQIASTDRGCVRYRFIADLDQLVDQYRRLGGTLTR